MTKTIKLHTYDLQRTVIALIEAHVREKKNPERAEAYDRLSDLFAELNRLCTAANNYTLTVTVDDRSEPDYYEEAVELMDDELREAIHASGDYDGDPAGFLEEYKRRHRAKFGEEFTV